MKSKATWFVNGIIIGLAFILTFGCAGYNITYKGDGDGYDVFRPEPYLIIKPGDKAQVAEIIWLPNYKERYRIDTWNLFAKADFQFDLADGWRLTKISDKSDNAAIASKLFDVVQKATKAEPISLTCDIQLFRLIFNDKGEFTGLKHLPVVESE